MSVFELDLPDTQVYLSFVICIQAMLHFNLTHGNVVIEQNGF